MADSAVLAAAVANIGGRVTRKLAGDEHFRVECRVVDLVSLLRLPEGKTLEFKRDLSSPEGVLKSIVAFANSSGGTLLIGVEDQSKKVAGVKDVLQIEGRLTNLIADSISPQLMPSVEVLPWRKTHIVAVQVFPSPNRPHHLNRLGAADGVFVRVGSSNRKAGAQLIEELKRSNLALSFDEQPVMDLNSEAIDFRVASELFGGARKLTAEALRSLKITALEQGRVVPTVGGILLFGKGRRERFPDAWIQAGRFAGVDRRKLIDSAEIRSHLPLAVEEAIEFIRKHSVREAVIGEVKRSERWTLPAVALREAMMNAVVHADYSQHGAPIRIALYDDRLEIENPGLLLFGLTVNDIRNGVSKLRNRVIGRVFQELGLIEHWGSGIQRMTAACRDQGLDPPLLEEVGTHFRVTLSTIPRHAPQVDSRDQTILKALDRAEARGLSTSEVAKRVRLSPRAARTRLAALVAKGLVAEVGSAPQDPHRRYYLTRQG